MLLVRATPRDGMCVALAGASKRAGRDVDVVTGAGHPAWTAADGGAGRSDTLTTVVADPPSGVAILDGHTDALVQEAALPD